MTRYAHITGWGMVVPDKVLTNDDLAQIVDTNNEWIIERTGIERRYIAGAEDSSATLGVKAAVKALAMAHLKPADVDLIICSTSSPEHIFPATACLIQDWIGATKAGAFDLSAACTGFIFALNMATQAIRTGDIDNAVVIGTETLSRITDWSDRNTCVLFGDGAGAFVLQASNTPGGVISSIMRSDGSGGDLLSVPAGGSANPTSQQTIDQDLHFIKMKGRDVFRFATRVMARASEEAVIKAGMKIEDIDLIIPHQANKRIIESAARGLKLPLEKFAMNVQDYGNTSTASIPIATVEAVEQGRLQRGDNIVFVGFGGGLTWGAVTAIWTGPFTIKKPISLWWYKLMARIRSLLRRLWRSIEGLIWGRNQ